MKGIKGKGEVPHVWHTRDSEGGDVRHLAMGCFGAQQAHLLHHGMMGYDGEMTLKDEGLIGEETDRASICFDPHCVLYGLLFPSDEEE